MPVATEKPWLLRPDWAQGYADPEWTSAKDPRIWIGLLTIAITLPSLHGILNARGSERFWAIVVLLLPLAGLTVLIQGIGQRLRAKKFAGTRFVMRYVPGVLGGTLAGEIESRAVFPPATPVHVTLSCISISLARNDDSRWERVCWQSAQTVTASPGGPGTVIPVAFTIPSDAPESDTSNPKSQILWRLTAQADLPGGGFRVPFLAPVFRTETTEPTLTIAKLQSVEVAAAGDKPAGAHLEVAPSRDGGIEFHLGAARNKGIAAALTLFGLFSMAGGSFAAYASSRFHWIIGVLFGGAFLVIAGGIGFSLFAYGLWLWLGVTNMRVVNCELHVRSSMLGIARTRVVPASDILDFELFPGTQQGERVWYDLKLLTGDRRSTTIAGGMEKSEAEWCIAELRKALGV